MKKLILGLTAVLSSVIISHAQQTSKVEIIGNVGYQHFFLDDDADAINYSGGFLMEMGADYYIADSFYAGGALGFSLGVVTSEFSGIESWSDICDIRIPLHAGISSQDRKFKIETGPFLDFSVAGKTEVTSGSFSSDRTVTRLKDMDVDRVSLSWGFNVTVFKLKIGYCIKLTDSFYGKGGDAHIITIAWDF